MKNFHGFYQALSILSEYKSQVLDNASITLPKKVKRLEGLNALIAEVEKNYRRAIADSVERADYAAFCDQQWEGYPEPDAEKDMH